MLPSFPFSYLPENFGFLAAVFVIAISLMMLFVGSRIIQWLSFVVVGLMVAWAGTTLGGDALGPAGAVIGFVAGFALGGTTSLLFLPAGMGLAMGLVGVAIAQAFISVPVVPPLVGIVGFAYGYLLTDFLLPAISAVVGGSMLFDASISAGFPIPESVLVSATLVVAGTMIQVYISKRAGNLFGQRTLYRARKARGASAQV